MTNWNNPPCKVEIVGKDMHITPSGVAVGKTRTLVLGNVQICAASELDFVNPLGEKPLDIGRRGVDRSDKFGGVDPGFFQECKPVINASAELYNRHSAQFEEAARSFKHAANTLREQMLNIERDAGNLSRAMSILPRNLPE